MHTARLIFVVSFLLAAGASATPSLTAPGANSPGAESIAGAVAAAGNRTANLRAAASRERPSSVPLGKGVFLIASESLSDPNFSQTVVLLLEYDNTGAVGLIINRPTQVSLASLLPEEKALKNRLEPVFIGGPVGRTQLFLLLRSDSRPSHSQEIVDGIYATTSLETLREVLAEESAVVAFQAYAGYSGWGPGQLDAELMRGDWLVTRADSETVFEKATDSIWPELIRKNKGRWVRRSWIRALPLAAGTRPQGLGPLR